MTAPEEPASTPAEESASGRSGRVRKVLGAAGRGVRRTGQATGRGATATFSTARRAARAEGAGDSGLYRLIELHAFNAAGDAAVAISLANTIFFAQPGEARGQVALFLALTMLPFAVVAPLLGPFLDRFSHGRRWAIGGTMALRAFLCWLLADAVASNSIAMFPAALGVLVSSKAYGVARAATVPRLLPANLTLVKANSRISLAGVVGAAAAGPVAALASTFGAQWSLRFAFVVFAGATVLSVLLPAKVDSTAGEQEISIGEDADQLVAGSGRKRPKFRIPTDVVFALRCNAGLRILSGFLTMFMAFLLQQEPFPGWEQRVTLLLGLVVGAAGLGNTIGIALGSVLRRVTPAITVVVALVADAAMALVAALFFSLPVAVLLGLTAGVAQALGKVSLDATIQRSVAERNRTSAFARSETLLQLSWVAGGFLGIGMPLVPWIGMSVLAALMASWTAWVLINRPTTPNAPVVGAADPQST